MSVPNFGEFFHALIACAIEQCAKEEPQVFRKQLGRLLYFTLGHAHKDWWIQLRNTELNEHGHNLLITQLLQQLIPIAPAWLDRVFLRSLIQSCVRLSQAHWHNREELAQEVCHLFSLANTDLQNYDLTSIATLSPYLKNILIARTRIARKQPDSCPSLCPLPPDYELIESLVVKPNYWEVIAKKNQSYVHMSLRYFKSVDEARLQLHVLNKQSPYWAKSLAHGINQQWAWVESPSRFNLAHLLFHNPILTSEQAMLIMLPVLKALSALHKQNAVCSHLNPQNILIDQNCNITLGKPLLWKWNIDTVKSMYLDHLYYVSPELFNTDATWSAQSDIWAFGLIFYQLLSHKLTWIHETKPQKVIHAIQKHTSFDLSDIDPNLQSFITRCLAHDAKQRWSDATQALQTLEEIVERVSPLMKGQNLSQQWLKIMQHQALQRFVEETAILPNEAPEEEFLRFLRSELYHLQPSVQLQSIQGLFPQLSYLHQSWWSTQSKIKQMSKDQKEALASFRNQLSQIAPEFLFEQLTTLSQQKENLEEQYHDQLRQLQQKKQDLEDAITNHAHQVVLQQWSDLGLAQDLMPTWNMEVKSSDQVDQILRESSNVLISTYQPELLLEESSVPQEMPTEIIHHSAESAESTQAESTESTQAENTESTQAKADIPSTLKITVPEQEKLTLPEDVESDMSTSHDSLYPASLVQPSLSPSSLPPADVMSHEHIEAFENQLRADIHSTPPEERLEKLEEFSQRKRTIDISRPILSAAPPEYSSPPEVVPFETVFQNDETIVIKGEVEDVLQHIEDIAQFSSPPSHTVVQSPIDMSAHKSHEAYPGAIPQVGEWNTKHPQAHIFTIDTEEIEQEDSTSNFKRDDDPFSLATSMNIDDDDLLWEDPDVDSPSQENHKESDQVNHMKVSVDPNVDQAAVEVLELDEVLAIVTEVTSSQASIEVNESPIPDITDLNEGDL